MRLSPDVGGAQVTVKVVVMSASKNRPTTFPGATESKNHIFDSSCTIILEGASL